MAEPFIAEVRMWTTTFAPINWAPCGGELLPISQNSLLYSMIGTSYGGDGEQVFAVPDLKGTAPMHWGWGPGLSNRPFGLKGGHNTVALEPADLPKHTHDLFGDVQVPESGAPSSSVMMGILLSNTVNVSDYAYADFQPGQRTNMSNDSLAMAGAGESHQNMQPFLTLNFCVALDGALPHRT